MKIPYRPIVGLVIVTAVTGCEALDTAGEDLEIGEVTSALNVTDDLGTDTTYAAAIDGLPLRQIATVSFNTTEGTNYRVSSKALIQSTDTKLFWLGQVACYRGAALLDQRTDERDTQQNQPSTVLYPRLIFTGPTGGGLVTCNLNIKAYAAPSTGPGSYVVAGESYVQVRDVHAASVEQAPTANIVLDLGEDLDVSAVDPFVIPDVGKTLAVSGDVTLTACMTSADGELGCPTGQPSTPRAEVTVSAVFFQKRLDGTTCKVSTLETGSVVLETNGGATGTRSRHLTVYRGGLFTPLNDPLCNHARVKTYVHFTGAGVPSQKLGVHKAGGATGVMPTP